MLRVPSHLVHNLRIFLLQRAQIVPVTPAALREIEDEAKEKKTTGRLPRSLREYL